MIVNDHGSVLGQNKVFLILHISTFCIKNASVKFYVITLYQIKKEHFKTNLTKYIEYFVEALLKIKFSAEFAIKTY